MSKEKSISLSILFFGILFVTVGPQLGHADEVTLTNCESNARRAGTEAYMRAQQHAQTIQLRTRYGSEIVTHRAAIQGLATAFTAEEREFIGSNGSLFAARNASSGPAHGVFQKFLMVNNSFGVKLCPLNSHYVLSSGGAVAYDDDCEPNSTDEHAFFVVPSYVRRLFISQGSLSAITEPREVGGEPYIITSLDIESNVIKTIFQIGEINIDEPLEAYLQSRVNAECRRDAVVL